VEPVEDMAGYITGIFSVVKDYVPIWGNVPRRCLAGIVMVRTVKALVQSIRDQSIPGMRAGGA
jgi:hypothetical protein